MKYVCVPKKRDKMCNAIDAYNIKIKIKTKLIDK